MQSYDDFRLIPRNQAISSPTCVDKRLVFGVLNKRLNEQVKRNIERFPDDFMFQLTKEEWNVLRSQIATAKTPEEKTIALVCIYTQRHRNVEQCTWIKNGCCNEYQNYACFYY